MDTVVERAISTSEYQFLLKVCFWNIATLVLFLVLIGLCVLYAWLHHKDKDWRKNRNALLICFLFFIFIVCLDAWQTSGLFQDMRGKVGVFKATVTKMKCYVFSKKPDEYMVSLDEKSPLKAIRVSKSIYGSIHVGDTIETVYAPHTEREISVNGVLDNY
jgi:hypothetical protein